MATSDAVSFLIWRPEMSDRRSESTSLVTRWIVLTQNYIDNTISTKVPLEFSFVFDSIVLFGIHSVLITMNTLLSIRDAMKNLRIMSLGSRHFSDFDSMARFVPTNWNKILTEFIFFFDPIMPSNRIFFQVSL